MLISFSLVNYFSLYYISLTFLGTPLNGYGVPMHEKLVTLGRYFGVSWVLLQLDSSIMVRTQIIFVSLPRTLSL